MLVPLAGSVAVSWKRIEARCVLEYSGSGTQNWLDLSLAIASWMDAISLMASVQAFYCLLGGRVLFVKHIEDLHGSDSEGVRERVGMGICDMAHVPVPKPIWVVFVCCSEHNGFTKCTTDGQGSF